MQTGIHILLALMIGVIAAIYLPMNSSVSRHLGSPLTANITFYSVALVTSILLFLVYGEYATLANLGKVPSWLYLTGFISAFIVLAITFLIPKIGARQLVVLSVAGQMIMAMLISHFGLLESPHDPITVKKVAGAALLVAGVAVSVN
jgi:transporter family-2 protein